MEIQTSLSNAQSSTDVTPPTEHFAALAGRTELVLSTAGLVLQEKDPITEQSQYILRFFFNKCFGISSDGTICPTVNPE